MRVGYVDFWQEVVQRPQVGNWTPTIHEDDKSPLAADEVDKELKEGVYREGLDKRCQYETDRHRTAHTCLINISERVYPECCLEGYQANPGRQRVDRHPTVPFSTSNVTQERSTYMSSTRMT
jgi:hypothetical protein